MVRDSDGDPVLDQVPEIELDEGLYEDSFEADALLASIEACLEDAEPWERLTDVLSRITGDGHFD